MDQKPPEAAPDANGGRVIAIVLVALLAVCFVGSCSVGAVSLVSSIADNTKRSDDVLPKPKAKPFAPKKIAPDPDEEQPPVDDDALPPDPLAVAPDLPDAPPEADAAPVPWVAPDTGYGQFSIFHVAKPKTDGWTAIQRIAKTLKLKVYRDEYPDEEEGSYLVYRALPVEEYGPMDGEALDLAHGLTDKEKDAVLEAKSASVVDLTLLEKDRARLADVAKLMLELQKATGGVLWDEEAQEYFSAPEWKKLRIDSWEKTSPDALRHFTVFVTTTGDSCELLTGGIAHFGLPELKVTRVPVKEKNATISLINVLAQQLMEGTVAAEPGRVTLELNKVKHKARRETWKKDFKGGKGEAELELVSVGTISKPVLEVRFPGGGSVAKRLGATLDSLLGPADAGGDDGGGAGGAAAEDPAVLKVSQAQMKIFAASVKPRFVKGLKAGETLSVLAPFPADSGGNEWVWVKVQKIKPDGTIIGLLAATPKDVGGLVSGDEVVVVEAELLDWMLKDKNGTTTGNETAKVFKRLGK